MSLLMLPEGLKVPLAFPQVLGKEDQIFWTDDELVLIGQHRTAQVEGNKSNDRTFLFIVPLEFINVCPIFMEPLIDSCLNK